MSFLSDKPEGRNCVDTTFYLPVNSAQPERRGRMEENQNLTKILWYIGWGVMAIAAAVLWLLRTGHLLIPGVPGGCVIRSFTGIYCPSCGGTRSVLALCQGQILTSFLYHPAVPVGAIFIVWFQLSNLLEEMSGGRLKIGLRYRHRYLIFFGCLFLLNMVLKNLGLFLLR